MKPSIFLRSLLAVLVILPLLSASGYSETITRPTGEKLRQIPGHERQLVLRRITSVNGKRDGVHFGKNQPIEIRGAHLSNGDIGSLQGWIIGGNRGGSLLKITHATSELIIAHPIDVSGANSVWPVHSGGSSLPLQAIRVLIRDDNQPGRDLSLTLSNSYYACTRGEQVCGGR